MSAASECEYGCSNGLLYDPRIEGSVVDCPGCKVSRDNAGEEPADAAVTVRDSAAASPEPTAATSYPTEFVDCSRCDGQGEVEDDLWVWTRCYSCWGRGTVEVCAECGDNGEECDVCGC